MPNIVQVASRLWLESYRRDTHTHTHTRTHARTHARTHTHTHAPEMCKAQFSSWSRGSSLVSMPNVWAQGLKATILVSTSIRWLKFRSQANNIDLAFGPGVWASVMVSTVQSHLTSLLHTQDRLLNLNFATNHGSTQTVGQLNPCVI